MNSTKKIIGLLFIVFSLSGSIKAEAQEGFIGEIRMFGGNFPPRGWAFCEGQTMAINSNTALFSILGTMYGGDGRTTFKLPDFRGRVAISAGRGPGLQNYVQGQMGGQEFPVLSILQMPQHTHAAVISNISATINVNEEDGNSSEGNGKYFGNAEGVNIYNSDVPDGSTKLGAGSISIAGGNVTVGNSGGSQSFDNRQPYTTVRYIICLFGVFPSRN